MVLNESYMASQTSEAFSVLELFLLQQNRNETNVTDHKFSERRGAGHAGLVYDLKGSRQRAAHCEYPLF